MTVVLDIAPAHLAQVMAILARDLPPGVAVLAFGSRARGGAKRFSDLDLALKADGPLDPAILARLADAFEESSLPWRVDLLDYYTLSPSFLAAVEADFQRVM